MRYMNEGQPSRPANVTEIVAINQGRSPYSFELPVVSALSVQEAIELLEKENAVFVDPRLVTSFGEEHIPGAYNFQISESQFEQRVGWVLPEGAPIILVAEDAAEAETALKKLAFVGLDSRVAGYLAGGLTAWKQAAQGLAVLPQISPEELSKWREALGGKSPVVLDVRERDEWDDGHIEGAVWMTYKDLAKQFDSLGLDPEQPVVVTCGGGYRSSTACSVLLGRGFKMVHNLAGGMDAWKKAGFPAV